MKPVGVGADAGGVGGNGNDDIFISGDVSVNIELEQGLVDAIEDEENEL